AISAIPVVTVGESQAFVSDGGAINFVLEGDKVRFEVNTTSADHAGVKISAQLLKLATTVRRS
ncbi:MAG TPA: YfiR family protein, partial [Steroidobacteraceae bacterium]